MSTVAYPTPEKARVQYTGIHDLCQAPSSALLLLPTELKIEMLALSVDADSVPLLCCVN